MRPDRLRRASSDQCCAKGGQAGCPGVESASEMTAARIRSHPNRAGRLVGSEASGASCPSSSLCLRPGRFRSRKKTAEAGGLMDEAAVDRLNDVRSPSADRARLRSRKGKWRRRRDSNPRSPFGLAHLANECLQPLGHVSRRTAQSCSRRDICPRRACLASARRA
jgi:hypothetical protein